MGAPGADMALCDGKRSKQKRPSSMHASKQAHAHRQELISAQRAGGAGGTRTTRGARRRPCKSLATQSKTSRDRPAWVKPAKTGRNDLGTERGLQPQDNSEKSSPKQGREALRTGEARGLGGGTDLRHQPTQNPRERVGTGPQQGAGENPQKARKKRH